MKFVAAPGLDARVAAMVAPAIARVAETVADAARLAAPDDKVWITLGDDRVRPEHRHAHGQAVPSNLRFTLETPPYDQQHHGAGPHQLARAPRDPDLTPGLTIGCRCHAVLIEGLARHISTHPPTVSGPLVTARVTCEHHLCVTAENGTAEDQGARFMAAGLRAGARRLRR